MNVGTYATTIQARAMRERETIEEAYKTYPDSTLFWGFVDLQGSSRYRLSRGAREGYVRAETFFSLVRGIIAPCEEVTLIKEIGDEVMLACPSFRPLLEAILLLDQSTWQLSSVLSDEQFPFAVRAAIGFGPAKRLIATRRSTEDYIGTSIDELARIMATRAGSNIKVSRSAFEPSTEIIEQYRPAVTVGTLVPVVGGKAEHHPRDIFYRDLLVDRALLGDFRDYFIPWKQSLVDGAKRHS